MPKEESKMIRYIEQKKIDYEKLDKILSESHSSNQFTNLGPAKRKLELKLEEMLEINQDKCVVCVSNGTLALHAIYLHLKEKKIKWVSPSFTFPSCCVGNYDCDIVDIDKNYSISLSEKILEQYDGFVITNLFGTYPSNIQDWIYECRKKNKILVFDNASSPLTKIEGINFCNLGNFSFGSLHHTKFLGFGEGGFLVCDKQMYMEMNRICGFGFQRVNGERIFQNNSSNFKMSDIAAASILQHIEQFDILKYISNQHYLVENLANLKNAKLFNYSDGVVYGNLPILFNYEISTSFFIEREIEAQKYYKPIKDFHNSIDLYKKIINFPLNQSLTKGEMEHIINVIKIADKK